MTKIYDQHDAAFANVEAYVILDQGERVATIAFKFPRDGAGRLFAYVHWFGLEMCRGYATGGGYDKRSAALSSAAPRITRIADKPEPTQKRILDFRDALLRDGGSSWDRELREAGFVVLQAV